MDMAHHTNFAKSQTTEDVITKIDIFSRHHALGVALIFLVTSSKFGKNPILNSYKTAKIFVIIP